MRVSSNKITTQASGCEWGHVKATDELKRADEATPEQNTRNRKKHFVTLGAASNVVRQVPLFSPATWRFVLFINDGHETLSDRKLTQVGRWKTVRKLSLVLRRISLRRFSVTPPGREWRDIHFVVTVPNQTNKLRVCLHWLSAPFCMRRFAGNLFFAFSIQEG